MIKQLGVIGCGLMGGSFALALRRALQVERVVGFSKSTNSLGQAIKMGVIDAAVGSAAEAALNSDVVLIAVPVSATETTLRSLRGHLQPDALLMDVGSTKRHVVDAARRVLGDDLPAFVPAHPIAGKERAGIEHADAALFEQRQVILTPLPQTTEERLHRAASIWAATGARVHRMTAEQHDAAFAAVSHLPHLLGFAYFNAVLGQPLGREFLAVAGPGFRDFTRVAAADPLIWRDILSSNREEVLKQCERFRQTLQAFEVALTSGNEAALEDLITRASTERGAWQMGGASGR